MSEIVLPAALTQFTAEAARPLMEAVRLRSRHDTGTKWVLEAALERRVAKVTPEAITLQIVVPVLDNRLPHVFWLCLRLSGIWKVRGAVRPTRPPA